MLFIISFFKKKCHRVGYYIYAPSQKIYDYMGYGSIIGTININLLHNNCIKT